MRVSSEGSPFISLTEDVAAAARTRDPILRAIIHGEGDPSKWAPDIGVFVIPKQRLVLAREFFSNPHIPAVGEREALFLGNDLRDYLLGWMRNPYGRK